VVGTLAKTVLIVLVSPYGTPTRYEWDYGNFCIKMWTDGKFCIISRDSIRVQSMYFLTQLILAGVLVVNGELNRRHLLNRLYANQPTFLTASTAGWDETVAAELLDDITIRTNEYFR